MNWLKQFMVGRYGGDQLSLVLLIGSFLLSWAGGLSKLPLLTVISYVFLGLCLFRMLSRNIEKRRLENYKFAILFSPVYAWLKKTQSRLQDAKTNCYFICPTCKVRLRVPRGKGKIIITCPRCKTEFAQKT